MALPGTCSPLHTLISFAWMGASANILYARRLLLRTPVATTGVMAHTYNPNTTQGRPENQRSEASLAYLHSEFRAIQENWRTPWLFHSLSADILCSQLPKLQTMTRTHGCHGHSIWCPAHRQGGSRDSWETKAPGRSLQSLREVCCLNSLLPPPNLHR